MRIFFLYESIIEFSLFDLVFLSDERLEVAESEGSEEAVSISTCFTNELECLAQVLEFHESDWFFVEMSLFWSWNETNMYRDLVSIDEVLFQVFFEQRVQLDLVTN